MTDDRGTAEPPVDFFRGLVNHLTDLVIVIDATGAVRYTSDVGITGPARLGPGEVAMADEAVAFFDLIHPDDRHLVDECIATALDHPGPTAPIEMRAAGRTGWRVLELVAGNLLEEPGVHGVLVAVRDLSRRRRLEPDVADRPQRLRALLDASDDLALLTDASQIISYCSTVSTRVLGAVPAQLVGLSLRSIVHTDSVPVLDTAWEQLLRAPSVPIACDLRVARSDGSYGILAAHLTNFLDDPAVESVAVAARDVTAERRAQLLLEEFGQQFEHSPHGLARLDGEGRFHEVNQRMRELTGREEAELLLTTLGAIVHPGDLEPVRDFLRDPVASSPVDVRLVQPAGGEIWGRLRPTMVRRTDDGGRLLSVQIDDINDHRRLEEALRERNAALTYRATHDGLTGLPNRQLFIDRVGHALDRSLRHRSTVAILFCDLDHFKTINDTFGHPIGDQLLVAISEEIGRAVRPGDTISRFGGDEFVVLAEDLDGPDDAGILANRLLETMTQPILVEGQPMDATMSIGVAVASGVDDPGTLIAAADTAMYRAKRAGRACFRMASVPNGG